MTRDQHTDDSEFFEAAYDSIDIREYLRIIVKRRRSISIIFSLITALGLIYCFTATPIYKATAGIIIDKEGAGDKGSLQEAVFTDTSGQEYYQTLHKIFESRTVALKVIKQLELDKNEAFFSLDQDEDIEDETIEDRMINAFLKNLQIAPVMKSHYVNINFFSKDPVLAAAVANAMVDAYREHALAMKLESVQNTVSWLNSNLEQERIKVETAQAALLRYKEEQGIVTDFSTSSETITAQKLAQLNSQVAEASALRTEAQTRYKQAEALVEHSEQLGSIPEVLGNELIRQIKTQEVELVQKHSELSKKYGANHPQMLALQSEMQSLEVKKDQEIHRITAALRNTYEAMLAREEALKEALEAQKNEAFNLNRTAITYTGLYCEAEGAQAMYALLLKRLKETSVTENLSIGNIRVVDAAKKPIRPVKPKKGTLMLLTVILGLGAAIGSAFVREFLHDAINTPEDIKQHLRIPFLGMIPLNCPQGSTTEISALPPSLEAFYSPRSPISESYRSVRTNIFYSLPEAEPQVILVTSSLAQEGKSTTSINLGITMAQFGYKVVLLDCDFHRGEMRKVFNIRQDEGMTDLLVGNKQIEEVVCATDIPNLQLIPRGPIPPNPSDILGSKKMQAIVDELRLCFDKIIIDSAPVALVTDTLMTARSVDGIVFIIRANSTPRKTAVQSLESLQGIGVPILGAVINGFDIHKDSYYGYSQYQQGYYCADARKKSKFQGLTKRFSKLSRKALKEKFLCFFG